MRDLSKTGCRLQALGLLALLLWATVLPVQAAGIPVFDSAAVAQAMKALEQATEQAHQMNAMLEQVKLITQAFGQPGVQGTAFQDAFLSMADGQSAVLIKDQLAALKKVAGALGKDGAGSSNPDFSTFASSQNWVNSQLAVLSNADQTTKTQVRRSRNLMAGQATADAYALALNARSQLAGMDDRAQSLVSLAGGATDLRGDLAANTAVMLAIHDEMTQLQALMAALLEVQSASHLAGSDLQGASSSAATPGPTSNGP